jgi:diadenosine tetraphosphate (Ap4A) HIT family hydrolase
MCQQQGEVVISTPNLRVVLVDDAHYPGYCRVIWNKHVKEMTDLTMAERHTFINALWPVESAVRDVMKPDKVNLASFGNVTPHLHWHIIPRFTDDMHFPNPIWGQVERSINERLAKRKALIPALKAQIKSNFEQS